MGKLAGVGVLVTRPARQAEALCRLIEEAGGVPVRCPLIEIEPLGDVDEGVSPLNDLGNVQWLIFVSANAVNFALDKISIGSQGFLEPRIAAIGLATAEALRSRGVQVDLIPKPQFNSEALLAMPELADVQGMRVIIVRGRGGREQLAETLRSRGASVEYAEVYRRVIPEKSCVSEIIDMWRSGRVHAVTLTSGEALTNLVSLLGEGNVDLLKTTPLVVASERVAMLAEAVGCKRVVTAQNPMDQALIQAVIETMQDNLNTPIMNGDNPLTDEDAVNNSSTSDTSTISAEKPIAEIDPVKKKPHIAAWLGYLSLVVVLLLAVGGFFLLQELRSKQEGLGGELNKGDQQMLEITHQITGLQSELATLHAQLANIESQVTTEDSKFERQLSEQGNAFTDKVDSTRNDLAAAIHHIQRQMNQTKGDLMVADAEYLLSVANQKLHLVGDVKAVIAMMEAADQRLYDSGDPSAFKVREALAEEITLLKSISPPDIVGTSAKLLVLEAKVKEWPTFLPHSSRQGELRGVSNQDDKDTEHGGMLDSAVRDLKDLVTVRHSDRPLNAILSPEEVNVVRQVMLLRLELIRAALLRGDDVLLQASVDAALDWLKINFDGDAGLVKDAVSEIQLLRDLKIQMPFPDVSKSLSLLRNIERLRVETEKNQASPRTIAPTKPTVTERPEPVLEQPKSEVEPAGGAEIRVQPESGAKQ